MRTITAFRVFPLYKRNVYQNTCTEQKARITVKLNGQCKIVGPQNGTSFMSTSWLLEFGSGSNIFAKLLEYSTTTSKKTSLPLKLTSTAQSFKESTKAQDTC